MSQNDIPENQDDAIPVRSEPVPEYAAPQQPAEPVMEREPISEPYHAGKMEQKYRTLNVPNVPMDDQQIFNAMQDEEKRLAQEFKEQPNSPVIRNFLATLESFQEIIATMYGDKDFHSTIARMDAEWTQRVTGDKGKKITISNPPFSLDKGSDRLEGMNAIRFLSAATGVGDVIRIPLWHSGIVLTLDSFKERRLLDLHQTLVRQRMDLGTNTKGATYSGDDVYTTITIVNFLLEHVIDSNVKGITGNLGEALKEYILVLDIPALMAGGLAAIYPRGYPIFHQCINTLNGSCDYSITAERTADLGDYKADRMLDFRKVLWTDKTRLETIDCIHMSAITPTHTFDEVREYQKRVNHVAAFAEGKLLFENNKVRVFGAFKIPNLNEYERICVEWCTRVMEMVDRTMVLDSNMGQEDRDERRNEALNAYASAISLLKHANWIDYLSVVDNEGMERRVVESQSISNSLEVLGQADGFEEALVKELQTYKEACTFSLTGLPNFECPKCHSGQVEPGARYPSLIPINMVSYFFILTVWRNRTMSGNREI